MVLHENAIKKEKYDEAELVSDIGLRYNVLSQPVMSKEGWGVPVPHEFDGKSIMIQQDYNGYLEQKFGNYMQLPPISMRKPSHQYSWRCPWWLGPTNLSEQK